MRPHKAHRWILRGGFTVVAVIALLGLTWVCLALHHQRAIVRAVTLEARGEASPGYAGGVAYFTPGWARPEAALLRFLQPKCWRPEALVAFNALARIRPELAASIAPSLLRSFNPGLRCAAAAHFLLESGGAEACLVLRRSLAEDVYSTETSQWAVFPLLRCGDGHVAAAVKKAASDKARPSAERLCALAQLKESGVFEQIALDVARAIVQEEEQHAPAGYPANDLLSRAARILAEMGQAADVELLLRLVANGTDRQAMVVADVLGEVFAVGSADLRRTASPDERARGIQIIRDYIESNKLPLKKPSGLPPLQESSKPIS